MHAGSKELSEATRYLAGLKIKSAIGIVLGTGLGDEFVRHIGSPLTVPYNSIPYFPVSTVSGHRGQFVYGTLAGKKILAMQGRFHFYEGYTMQKVTFSVRVMQALGVRTLLISNAAGNLNPTWSAGELMLIRDHIDLMPDNPLRNLSRLEKGNIFLPHREMYSRQLLDTAQRVAKRLRMKLHTGVYVANMGPAIETKAEYKFLRLTGGDAVGMSTVPEVLMANYLGMQCLAVSVLTNDARKQTEPLSLADVIAVAAGAAGNLTRLFKGIIETL